MSFNNYIAIGVIAGMSVLFGCRTTYQLNEHYISGSLKISRLTKNTFIHTSYLNIPDYGKFACNGLIYIHKNEAVVFDTPSEDSVSTELIEWIENDLDSKIRAVVVNHFHSDCLGGLAAFHIKDIESHASHRTIDLANIVHVEVPRIGFDEVGEIKLGESVIRNQYFGEGHTRDNIVSYIPSEKVLFGGCLIKAIGAGKGNLQDATVSAWPGTVSSVKRYFPRLKIVVPGHGQPGGVELLDYTINMFSEEE